MIKRIISTLAAGLFLIAAVPVPAIAAESPMPKIEGYRTLSLPGTGKNRKWTQVLMRYANESIKAESPREMREWYSRIGAVIGLPRMEQLIRVQTLFDDFPYRSDPDLWHRPDYWASPLEFMRARSGDCEDFAIAKYFALRELGVPVHAMSIIVMVDRLREKPAHAVLMVALNGTTWILDNLQNGMAISQVAFLRYRPIYQINEQGFALLLESPDAVKVSFR